MRPCVVVVEDEEDIRVLLAQLLEDERYRVLAFAHPLPATELHASGEIADLFLIDIMLPGLDGVTLGRHLRHTRFAATPKIAMSASPEALARARVSGHFHGFLSKPFDIEPLLKCVEDHIRS